MARKTRLPQSGLGDEVADQGLRPSIRRRRIDDLSAGRDQGSDDGGAGGALARVVADIEAAAVPRPITGSVRRYAGSAR